MSLGPFSADPGPSEPPFFVCVKNTTSEHQNSFLADFSIIALEGVIVTITVDLHIGAPHPRGHTVDLHIGFPSWDPKL